MKKFLKPKTIKKRRKALEQEYTNTLQALRKQNCIAVFDLRKRCPHQNIKSDDGWDSFCTDCGEYWKYRRS